MKKTPKISVCVPAYNAEKTIAQTVESVLAQTFPDFELIVLDNKSTDNTLSIVRKYKDKRITVIAHKKNFGAEANWNSALKAAKAPYVKILCADDYLYPDCLIEQSRTLDRNPGAAVVCNARDIVDDSGKRIMTRGPSRSETIEGREAVRRAVRGGTNIYGETSSSLFRRDAQKKAGFFDASIPYIIDLDMLSRLLLHGTLVTSPVPLSAYRVGSSSWSAEIMGRQRDNFVAFIERLQKGPFGITKFDAAAGRFRSLIQMLLRQIFYRFVLGWKL